MTELEHVVEDSPRLRERTKAIYLQDIRRFLNEVGRSKASWTPNAAQKFYNGLLKTMKPQSANRIIWSLRYASKRLVDLHRDPRYGFATAIEMAKNEQTARPLSITRPQAKQLIDSCNSKRPIDIRDRAIITLALRTGMRRFSLCGINFEDFGKDRKRGYDYVEITLKGGKRHKVPLSQSIIDGITPWRTYLAKQGVKTDAFFRSMLRRNLADTIEIGTRLTENGLYAVLKARVKHAGLEGELKLNPHVFRHTFITWCQEARVPIYAITAITGHQIERGASIVDTVYTDHTVAGSVAIDAIDELWGQED